MNDATDLILLALEDITKSYGSTLANDAVSLAVRRGQTRFITVFCNLLYARARLA